MFLAVKNIVTVLCVAALKHGPLKENKHGLRRPIESTPGVSNFDLLADNIVNLPHVNISTYHLTLTVC